MAQNQTTSNRPAEIDPNDAMMDLESPVSDSAASTDGAGAPEAAGTTQATIPNSGINSAPETAGTPAIRTGMSDHPAEGAANEQSSASAVTNSTETSQQIPNRVPDTGSIFEQGAARSEGRAVTLADSDLIMVDGKLIPYGRIKNEQAMKPRLDRAESELQQLRSERASVLQRTADLNRLDPFLKEMQSDPFIRTYVDTKVMTQDPERARRAAEIAAGVVPSGYAGTNVPNVPPDPRLEPPLDPHTKEPFPDDTPEYLRWYAGPRAEAVTEAATRKVIQEERATTQAEADRKAKADRDAEAARTAQTERAQSETNAIVNENLRILGQLDTELKKRGVDTQAMSPEEWQRAKGEFASAMAQSGRPLSNEFLSTHVLLPEDIGIVLDAKQVVQRIRPNGDRGPGKAPETAAVPNGVATNGAAANGVAAANGMVPDGTNAERALGLRNNFSRQAYGQRPLMAGAPSEAIAGRPHGAIAVSQLSDEDATLEALNSLG